MGIEITQVKVQIDGDKKSLKKLDKFSKKAKEATKDAKAAAAAQAGVKAPGAGGLGSRWLALKARAKKKGILKEESLEWGPLALTRSGFAVPEEFRKGQTAGRAGPLLKGAFVATVAGQAIGAALNGAADAINFFKTRPSWEEVKDASTDLALDASSSLYEATGAKSILKGITRLAGTDPAVFEAAYADAFTSGPTAVQKAANDPSQLAAVRAQVVAFNKANAAKEEALRNQLEKWDEEHAKLSKGLKVKVHAVKGVSLNREANSKLQSLMREFDQKRLDETFDKRVKPVNETLQEMEGV